MTNLSHFLIFLTKKSKNWNIFGWLFNLKMYLLNRWADSVQPVGADCWNTGFFIPGNLIICSWVNRQLFACNCWMGIILQPFLANCGQFFLDFQVFVVNRALCWGLIWHRASHKLYQGQMLWVKVMKLSQLFDFFYKKWDILADFPTLECCIFWTVGPTLSNQLGWIAETLFFSSQAVSSCVFWLFTCNC